MAADGLATHWARTSAAMVLTELKRIIPVAAPESVGENWVHHVLQLLTRCLYTFSFKEVLTFPQSFC